MANWLPSFKTPYALCALSIVVSLGCTPPQPIIQTVPAEINVSAATLTCPTLPVPPDPDDPETTQRDIAVYITDLTTVAEHCRRDLRTVRQIINEWNQAARARGESVPE